MILPKEKILYSQHFEKNKNILDLYQLPNDAHKHILKVNEMLKKMNECDNSHFAYFLLEQKNINNEISNYCFKHFHDVGKIYITNNGSGLEIGIKVELKMNN